MKLTLLAFFLATAAAPAAIVQYTDQASFLAELRTGAFTADFIAQAAGDVGSSSLSLSGGTPPINVTIASLSADGSSPGELLWISDSGNLDKALGASVAFDDQLLISLDNFYAIGGHWFLGDVDDNYVAGSVTLVFSDNSTYTVTSSAFEESYRGFISDVALASVRVFPAGGPGHANSWVTLDNLTIGQPVPEPGAALLLAVGVAPILLHRRRH